MEARPCQIVEFFDGAKQMLVPLFQRPYEWKPTDWETLWEDLLEQYENDSDSGVASHFTGAVVTAPARSVPVGVAKHLVIDGQQRLTTVAVLICALRGMFEVDTPRYRKLTRLLINEDDEGLDRYKLLPTQPDRAAFQALVEKKALPGTRLAEALGFFQKKLRGNDSNGDPIDIERMTTALQSRLTVVSINLGDADDPYLIFESLNAKGAPLTQADLIRNYLLLRLKANDQQKAYDEAWLPMQSLLPGDELTEFMRQFLMLTGEEVAKSGIYSVLKRRLLSVPDEAVASELLEMKRAAQAYAHIIGRSPAANSLVADGLDRLRRWEVTTANPLLLKLLLFLDRGVVSAEEVSACIGIIESFVVRRTVCSVPTNQMKRIFLSVTKDIPPVGAAGWLAAALASGGSGRRWPKDPEFEEGLQKYRAYASPLERCNFLLERLENQHAHKEATSFASATVEHVMPKTLNAEWIAMLGPNAAEVHERWLDCLGNLTLTAYNSELSNSEFPKKKELLADSHFEMNRWIARQPAWTEVELVARTQRIFELAKEIWPRLDSEPPAFTDNAAAGPV